MLTKCLTCFLLCSISSWAEHKNTPCLPSEDRNYFILPPAICDQKKIEEKIHQTSPEYTENILYFHALLAICQKNMDQAALLIKKALELNPNFEEAKLQLGYIHIWKEQWQEALLLFTGVQDVCPCQKEASEGLEQIAHYLEKNPPSQKQALEIYRKLVQCEPNQVDYLYYLGRLLSWMHEWKEAEEVLTACLKISPSNSDAAIQLGYLYLWEGRFSEAKEIFTKFTSRADAKEGLEKVNTSIVLKNRQQPLPVPFINPPTEADEVNIKEQISLRYPQDYDEGKEFGYLYLQALLFLCQNKNSPAKEFLRESVKVNPSFFEGWLQSGFVELWEGNLQSAEDALYWALSLRPCDKAALLGLEKVAHAFEKNSNSYEQALSIYKTLIRCAPDQADYLYYLGRLLAWMHEWQEAESVLLDCLKLSPNDSDAAMQLGYLYLWEGRTGDAKRTFKQFIRLPEAKVGLAKSLEKECNYPEAEKWYKLAAAEGALSPEVGHGIVRSLEGGMHYALAKEEYQSWIERYPRDDSFRRDFFEVKRHTDPSYTSNTRMIRAKENDPTLQAPVVKDYYFETDFSVLVPIFDRWNVDVAGFWAHQKERDIYPPLAPILLNYSVGLTGPRINSHFFFAKDWRMDTFFKIKSAWGKKGEVYPFISTTRFEPGMALMYHSDTQFFSASGAVDSFIVKDFAIMRSRLLQLDTGEAVYRYTFQVKTNPQIEGNVRRAWYNDAIKNIRTDEDFWLRCNMPFLEDFLSMFYHCFHSHFTHVTPNYFSFKEQVINTAGAKLHTNENAKIYAALIYEHAWWWTKDLVQPIGNLIYIAPLQVLTANRVEGIVGFRVKDTIRSEIKAHWYRNTLPYRDRGLQANFTWFF